MESHVDYAFLKMFLWERFKTIAATPVGYSATVPSKAGAVSTIGAKNIYRAGVL